MHWHLEGTRKKFHEMMEEHIPSLRVTSQSVSTRDFLYTELSYLVKWRDTEFKTRMILPYLVRLETLHHSISAPWTENFRSKDQNSPRWKWKNKLRQSFHCPNSIYHYNSKPNCNTICKINYLITYISWFYKRFRFPHCHSVVVVK